MDPALPTPEGTRWPYPTRRGGVVTPPQASLSPDRSSLRRRLILGGGWALSAKIVAALISLAVNAMLARMLSPRELGAYYLAFSTVILGASIGELGLGRAAVRLVAESSARHATWQTRTLVRRLLQLCLAGALAVFILYTAAGRVLSNHVLRAPALDAIVVLISFWMGATVVQRVITEIFRGFSDIRIASVLGQSPDGPVPAAILSCCLTILLVLDVGGVDYAVTASVLSALATVGLGTLLLVGTVRTLPRKAEPTRSDVSRGGHLSILSISVPMLVTNVTAFALSFQSDLWLLGIFRAQEEVALYGAAARLLFLINAPLMVINAVVPPTVAALNIEGRRVTLERLLRGTATLGGFAALGTFLIFAVLGGSILSLLFGAYYRAAAHLLVILGIGQVVHVASGSCTLALLMTGHEKAMMKISITMTALAVAFGIFAAALVGVIGMAYVSAGRLILQNVVTILAVKRLLGVRTYVDLSLRSLQALRS